MRLISIHVYPVKSCRGLDLDSAILTPRGLRGDRRWLVVDAEGRFLTQRAHPRMARIRVDLIAGGLRFAADGAGEVEVAEPATGDEVEVKVWEDTVRARRADALSETWLSSFLQLPCRLVWMPEESIRPVDASYGAPEDHVSFADAFPLLLTATASLDDLNARLATALPMNRFRPNLVVSGGEPFAEDTWSEVALGDVRLRVVKPCARCAVTTTDQASGERGEEPLRTLATYRRLEGKVMFGQNLIPSTVGELRVGMPLTVIASK